MFDHIPLTLAQNKDAGDGKSGIQKGGETPVQPTTDSGKTTGNGTTTVPNQPNNLPPGNQNQNPLGGPFIFILLGMFVLMIFFSMRTQKKERKKREAMLGALKKGDRIQTIGGILGNVVEVREHKVVVKVDENNNTKMTFARTAIQTIFEDKSDTEEADLSKTG